VIAPIAQIAGHLAILDTVNMLTGLEVRTAGRQYHQSFVDLQHNYYIEAPMRPDCPVCGVGAP